MMQCWLMSFGNSSAQNTDSEIIMESQLQDQEEHVGPYRYWPGTGTAKLSYYWGPCTVVSIFLSLSPLNKKAHRQREQRGSHGDISYLSASPPPCLQVSAVLGWRSPGRGIVLATASFSISIHWVSAFSDDHTPTSFPSRWQRRSPSWGEATTSDPEPHLQTLWGSSQSRSHPTFPLLSFPITLSRRQLWLNLSRHKFSQKYGGLPAKTGSQWSPPGPLRNKDHQAEGPVHTLQRPLHLCQSPLAVSLLVVGWLVTPKKCLGLNRGHVTVTSFNKMVLI